MSHHHLIVVVYFHHSHHRDVWAEAADFLNVNVLKPLQLSPDRKGWVELFDALPWESCAVHVQALRNIYDFGFLN
jgi:hypothetical protein